jgi:dihydroorotate dehydrogenase (NAD+) catalytic subunit
VAKYSNLDVEACGGLNIPEQCIEIMMLGAKKVQLSSGILWNGTSYPGKVIKFMKKYMEKQGYKSVNDFIGLGLKYVAEMQEVQKEYKSQVGIFIAKIDYNKCVGPDKCNICLDAYCSATVREGDKVHVDAEMCSGCNLCVIRCPYDARSMTWVK